MGLHQTSYPSWWRSSKSWSPFAPAPREECSTCGVTEVAPRRRLRGWYVGIGSGRCLLGVGDVVEGAPKAVGDREGCWAVEHWITDAETTFLDGDLGAESRIVGNGDFNDPREALHERSLRPFAHKGERAIQRHRSGTVADLAPAETQAEQHEGGGQGTVSGRFEA